MNKKQGKSVQTNKTGNWKKNKSHGSNKDIAKYYSDETVVDKSKVRHNNDVSWYVPDAQILKDVASIPYSFPVGVPYERIGAFDSSTVIDPANFDDAVPGILVAKVMPTLGNAKAPNDAVNVAANGLYTFVRHINSGSRNYDANDLMIYVLAVSSLYTVIHWAIRLYGTLNMYSQANRYLPRDLIEAQKVDFDDLLSNIAQFRAGLNARIPRIASLAVPAVLPIFQRHMWMFDHYYIEGPSEKDQIYMYGLEGYYQFTYDSDGAGMLEANGIGSNLTVNDIFTIIDSMMDPIFADEDFNIISGDIYKAYQGNVMNLASIPDNFMLGLEYAEDVLLQFKNLKCKVVLGESGTTHFKDGFFNVHQSTGKDYLITETPASALDCFYEVRNGQVNSVASISTSIPEIKACFAGIMNEYSKDILLTTPHANVEPNENMVNTRCTLALDYEYDSTDSIYRKLNNVHFASEWCLGFSTIARHRNRSTNVNSRIRYYWNTAMIVESVDIRIDNVFKSMIPILSSFKYHPEVALVTIEYTDISDPTTWHIVPAGRTIFELDNYTLVSHAVIARLHDTAIMGMYDIPRVAYFPTKR